MEPDTSFKPNITPFLWFNDNAEEAVSFYISLFSRSAVTKVSRYSDAGAKASGRQPGSVMTMEFILEGKEFVAMNGGPVFQFTPAISFFVSCATHQEIESLWNRLSEGGTVMMELETYPFSEKYGWVQDRFGVSWQLILPARVQKIAPCLMFAGKSHLHAEKAIHSYTSIFPDSSVIQLERYKTGQPGPEGAVIHSKFSLMGEEFVAMDSFQPLPHEFNPSVSFVVNCRSQEDIDYYWEKLSKGGDVRAQQCGWLQDQYGVSWQIVPASLGSMLSDPDPRKAGNVMLTLLQMKKPDLKELRKAYELN